MIIKTLRILLAFSCYLMSLQVLAKEAATEHELASKVISAAVVAEKGTVAKDIVQQGISQEGAAQDDIAQQRTLSPALVEKTPEVGKHVMANMDAGSMILSLLMVLALIIICAFVLKRFNLAQQGVSQLKVITSLSLGSKERVVVIQAGEQQLLLGVTAQQVTLIERLAEPLASPGLNTAELPKNLLSFLTAKKL